MCIIFATSAMTIFDHFVYGFLAVILCFVQLANKNPKKLFDSECHKPQPAIFSDWQMYLIQLFALNILHSDL